MFEITQFTISDIPIFIILFSALFLYFGIIIGSTQIQKYDKLGYYQEGLLFFVKYIYIPSLIAYYFYLKNVLNISYFLLVSTQVVIFFILSWNLNAQENIRKYELLDFFRSEVKKNVYQIMERDSIIGRIIKIEDNWYNNFKKYIDLFLYKIPIKIGNKYILGIFSFLTITSNFKLYDSGELLIFGFSLVLAFFILTMIALAYGFINANYPHAKVYLVDSGTIEGKVLKSGDYICILRDDKLIFVNKDKINYIEESLFDETKNNKKV